MFSALTIKIFFKAFCHSHLKNWIKTFVVDRSEGSEGAGPAGLEEERWGAGGGGLRCGGEGVPGVLREWQGGCGGWRGMNNGVRPGGLGGLLRVWREAVGRFRPQAWKVNM